MGLVLSREVSRLARTDKDWCHLQEVCQVFGVLLADAERVYDLGVMDDQLILGIKGTMSVVELNVLKMRLMEGMQAKARRGELLRLLPPGYVRDGQGQAVKDPDARVREAIDMIFRIFREAGSVRQTFLWFHSHGVELPVNKSRGESMQIVWQLPSHSFVSNVLHNPFYAGAYVWGQRPSEVKLEDGNLMRRCGAVRPAEECKVFIPEHHEGYISWSEFDENLRRMRGNNLKIDPDASVAAVHSGQGLLTRLLRCGRCGRKLHMRYWGRAGTAARYACKGDYESGGSYCLAFGGSTVDRRFSAELLKVITPLGMAASVQAIETRSQQDSHERQALKRQLEETEYAAQRAFEQYDRVDARNRLVAAELEQRWNAQLEEAATLTAALESLEQRPRPLTADEEQTILALGEDFAAVWNSEHCPVTLKKKIIRTVVEEVIVDADEEEKQLTFIIPLERRHPHAVRHAQATVRYRPQDVAGGYRNHPSPGGPLWRRRDRPGTDEEQAPDSDREAMECAAGHIYQSPVQDLRPTSIDAGSRDSHSCTSCPTRWGQRHHDPPVGRRQCPRERSVDTLGAVGNPAVGSGRGTSQQHPQASTRDRKTRSRGGPFGRPALPFKRV